MAQIKKAKRRCWFGGPGKNSCFNFCRVSSCILRNSYLPFPQLRTSACRGGLAFLVILHLLLGYLIFGESLHNIASLQVFKSTYKKHTTYIIYIPYIYIYISSLAELSNVGVLPDSPSKNHPVHPSEATQTVRVAKIPSPSQSDTPLPPLARWCDDNQRWLEPKEGRKSGNGHWKQPNPTFMHCTKGVC